MSGMASKAQRALVSAGLALLSLSAFASEHGASAHGASAPGASKQGANAPATPPAKAGLPPASAFCAPAPRTERRRPGGRTAGGAPRIEYELPACDPTRITPYPAAMELGPAMPDRWVIVQALGYKEQIWNPYEGHNPIKGDLPIWGDDWFFSITAVSDTLVEPRRFPVPVGVATTDRPASLDLITEGESTILNQQL